MNSPLEYLRYQDLTPVLLDDQQSFQQLRKKNSALTKQVDPAWLARRQQGGPSAKDLSLLKTPDPLVSLNFKIDREAASTLTGSESQKGRSSGETARMNKGGRIGGLEATVNPMTLLPKFSIDIK